MDRLRDILYQEGYEAGKRDAVIHAHWEDCTGSALDYFGAPVIVPKKRCSHCKETNKNYAPPYCPHCGALMDEEDT